MVFRQFTVCMHTGARYHAEDSNSQIPRRAPRNLWLGSHRTGCDFWAVFHLPHSASSELHFWSSHGHCDGYSFRRNRGDGIQPQCQCRGTGLHYGSFVLDVYCRLLGDTNIHFDFENHPSHRFRGVRGNFRQEACKSHSEYVQRVETRIPTCPAPISNRSGAFCI